MRILFCNIAWMNYYKGIIQGKDEPQNGGSYVKENLDAHEKYNFDAVSLAKESGYPDDVEKETYVVGWYKHATVYRNCEVMRFPSEDEEGYYDQAYNAIARKEDCVLLPRASRRKANIWKVPRKSKGVAYGFGQSNVWFAQGREENKLLDQFLNRIVKQIEEYSGKNWLDECAE